ncbi:hypothetical protein ABIA40_000253 [Bradyrhizobium sp. USDA 223]
MTLYALEAQHHGEIVLHATLQVDRHAIEAALGDHLGGDAGGYREPGIHHRFADDAFV